MIVLTNSNSTTEFVFIILPTYLSNYSNLFSSPKNGKSNIVKNYEFGKVDPHLTSNSY